MRHDIGMRRFVKMRNDLFHTGMWSDVPEDIERYAHLLLRDFLRQSLGLPCKRHVAIYVESGFDVGRLSWDKAKFHTKIVSAP